MPAYQGAYFSKTFTLKDATTEDPIDVSGWEFSADLRDRREDDEALLELTTANGGFEIVDGAAGQFKMVITAEQTAELPVAKIVFDVLRTDASPGPIWLFGGRFPVRQPVTRDD